jgi:ABC-type antimicrobial peptide transport system permease subunit
VRAALEHGLARLRRDRTRALLAAGGIAAATAMVAAAATLVFALATGFDRTAARAGLPEVTARFAPATVAAVAAHIDSLANVRRVAYRFEATNAGIEASGNFANGTVVGVLPGPRGYAVTSGGDVARSGEAVVEPGLARAWRLRPGATVTLSGPGGTFTERVVGTGIAPDSVAYPLTRNPRVYVTIDDARKLGGAGPAVNTALLWVDDPSQLPVTLELARAATYGVSQLSFVTRAGFRQLIGRAAGIVIALLVAFSLVALAAAGIMLAAASAAEVQRRREAIGILRTFGATPGHVAAGYAAEAALVAAPAAAVGAVGGWLAVGGPAAHLLEVLNELMPGAPAIAALLAACWLAVVVLVAAATWLPARRAGTRPVVDSLREADVVATPRRIPLPALAGFGARLALARPLRAAALVAVLAASTAVVLLILTIASVLNGLQQNAQTLGKRYQLVVPAGGNALARARAIPGVALAAQRYETDAVDSFDLGETFRFVSYPGDIARFEAPPLSTGRRVRTAGEADVGLGLAQALGLDVGSLLAAQLPSGTEVRFRVVGIVQALRDQGLVAYVQPQRLLAATPDMSTDVVIKLRAHDDLERVRSAFARHGLYANRSGGISEDSGFTGAEGRTAFLDVLATLLRSVAFLDGLVCVYALAQMLALLARERRRAVAVLRAIGASRAQVLALFAGAALLVAGIATPIGIALERFVLGPGVGALAISYVTLPLRAGAPEVGIVISGVAVAIAVTAGWATRTATAGAIVRPLREE